jgi:microcystin-dependent protein
MTRIFHTKVERGWPLLATDITDLTFFPIGSILMMDGNWQDGRGGWYICDGRATPYGNTPDLRDKFIKGTGSLAKTGGSNSLTAAMLPGHTHTVYTDATKDTARTANKSLAADSPCFQMDYRRIYTNNINGIITGTSQFTGGTDSGTSQDICATFHIDATHEHTGSANDDNSSTTDSNTNNLPMYYSVIYIKKCV